LLEKLFIPVLRMQIYMFFSLHQTKNKLFYFI